MVKRRMDVREFLDQYMEEEGITDIELATRLGYTSNSPVSMVRRNERNIPEEKIAIWADALRLQGAKRNEFIELAHLELAPSWLRAQYHRLKTKIEDLEKFQAEILNRLEKSSERDRH